MIRRATRLARHNCAHEVGTQIFSLTLRGEKSGATLVKQLVNELLQWPPVVHLPQSHRPASQPASKLSSIAALQRRTTSHGKR